MNHSAVLGQFQTMIEGLQRDSAGTTTRIEKIEEFNAENDSEHEKLLKRVLDLGIQQQ